MSIKCQSQETFFDILKQLNISDENNVEVSYNFKNRIINQDSSFFIKKTAQSRCDLKYILLNKNERFSVFGVFGVDEFKMDYDNLFIRYSHIMVVDRLINRNFVIEYDFDGYCTVLKIKKKKITLCSSAFEQNLSRITEVDSNFIPKWSLRLDDNIRSEEIRLCRIKKYILVDNVWYEKSKLFDTDEFLFKTLLYQDLLDFENENFDESIPIKRTDDSLPMYRFLKEI